jgi:hypothetical protein
MAHWTLRGDARDHAGGGHDAANHDVQLAADGASFSGRGAYLEVPHRPGLNLGDREFSLAGWIHTQRDLGGMVGDIASKFDHGSRRGFHLGIIDAAGVTTAQSNHRHLQFGMDAGTTPGQLDFGRPGRATLIFALAAHESHLYAATFEHGEREVGRVYRLVQGGWHDCALPNRANAVASLVGCDGRLFAATGMYDARGSAIAGPGNTVDEVRVWSMDSSGRWTDCGAPPGPPDLFFLAACRGRLYAAPNYRPALYRHEGGTRWEACPEPYPRFFAMAQWRGRLYAAANRSLRKIGPPPDHQRIFIPLEDADGVYRYDPDTNSWEGCGRIGEETQMYSFAVHRGELHVGTWPNCKVFRTSTGRDWEDCGRLAPDEREVMAMSVYNGMLYAGTLPAADVYRFDGPGRWTLAGHTDTTPAVTYRRAWSSAVHDGRLFVGTLPSGHVFAFEAGCATGWSVEWPDGWQHVAAVRRRDVLELYHNGRRVAVSRPGGAPLDLDNPQPLRIGAGPNDYFQGRMVDLRLYARALDERDIASVSRLSPPAGV